MKITFNPSTVAALIAPPNNKDITFDLRGHNIFARGVKFCGTDTNTWRDIKINNVSIDSNILDLRDGDNTTLTNINGVVTINSTWRPVVDNLTSDSTTSSLSANQGRILKSLIDSKSDSEHTHDDRYLRLTGGTMSGQISSSYSVGTWIGGCTNAILKATADGYNSLICAPIKSGNISISAWTAEDNLNFGYAKKGKTENSFDTRMYWDAPNNNLHAAAFTGHLYGTADNAGSASNLIVHQYLSNTDTTWYPLIWGGGSHYNTSDSTGEIYKSNDVLSWQTSSQTLYATHLQTTYIDLQNNRGISQVTSGGTSPYKGIKLPDLQNNGIGIFSRVGNGGDEGGIVLSENTCVIYNSFDTGWGLSVRDKDINQTDISGDNTIAFGIRQDHRAYSLGGFEKSGSDNSYVLLGGGGHQTISSLSVNYANSAGSASNLIVHQYLSNTDTTWYPLIWGGGSHYNTSDSTGEIYKSNDVLSWQTSSQTLYATHLQTTYIDLQNNRGISQVTSGGTSPYKGIKLPDLQNNGIGIFSRVGNGGDEGGIVLSENTCVIYNSFDTGWGLSVRDKDINQTDISGDNTIAFGIRQDHRAYSLGGFEKSGSDNSYVLLGGGGHQTISSLSVNYANSAGSVAWDSITGKPSSFVPSAHTHSWASITDKIVAGNEFNIVNDGFNGDIWFNYVPINDRRKTATVLSYIFGNGHQGRALVQASGFVKTGSSSSYVLLGDGGHQTISSLSVNYANSAGSATKLQTPRNIWGQSFDGTADVNGTIYINNSNSSNGAIRLNNNVNSNARISAISDQVIFNTSNAIRFGETSWDWNQWAGLKYTHSNKTIYLGIADGSAFYANSPQSNGTLRLAGITTITTNPGARIGNSGGDLYLGNANNNGWVKVQNICSHNGSDYWYIYQNGNAVFNYIKSKTNAYIVGNLEAGQIIRGGSSQTWVNGRNGALLRETSVAGYHTLWSLKTTDGSWDFGEYNAGSDQNNIPVLSYITDSNYNSGNNTPTYQIRFPLASGTVALTSNIPNPTNYYWANVKISASSSTTTSPTVSNLTATNSIKMGNISLEHTDEINNSANGSIYLNYRNSGNVNLCLGGGKVGIRTIFPSYELDVMGNTFTTGFGIRPYYLSNSELLPTISPGDGYTYRCLEIGRSAVVSCIIADKVALSSERGVLIKFNTGFDGQIVLLKDLQNYGDINGNGYFWVMPSGCKIISPEGSSIQIYYNQISNAYDDGKSRFFVYSSKYDAWIEFYCG